MNSVEIAICLIDFYTQTGTIKRLDEEEQKWFKAGFFIDQIFMNSDWQDIADNYYVLLDEARNRKFL